MQGRFFRQIQEFRSKNDSIPSLPFSRLVTEASIAQLIGELQIDFRERVYTPIVTLWIFLSQVISSDQSCRNAVAKFVAFRVAQELQAPSLETGSYCTARQSLPEELISRLARQTGQELHGDAKECWKFGRRNFKVIDGSTVSMPDEPANASYFGKSTNQRGEVGFPIARLVAVFCLATGALIEMVVSPYVGKRTGELSLFRQLMNTFSSGDILLSDQQFCTYCDIARLLNNGVDVVMRMREDRKKDFRKGKRLGREDHIVAWTRPDCCPGWLTPEQFAQIPRTLTLREMRIRVTQPGFRTKIIVVVTSLLDSNEFTKKSIGEMFRQRWHAELDLRSLKITLQMDVLRCKSPAMVKKEIWAHMLAYNLIRSLMCAAADEHQVAVRQISFKGAMQLLNAFYHCLVTTDSTTTIRTICDVIIQQAITHEVGNRPDRVEPRKRKRRPKSYPLLIRSRALEKQALLR